MLLSTAQSPRGSAAFSPKRAPAPRDSWAETPAGALALVIVLDQFSRNIHRGSPLAFAADARALALARRVVGLGWHHAVPAPLAAWFLLPFEHAEDLDAQNRAVGLFGSLGLAEMAWYAKLHRDVIAALRPLPAPQRHPGTEIDAGGVGLPRRRRLRRVIFKFVIAAPGFELWDQTGDPL